MAQFSLPILNTQYETVQKIPTSNWMTALGQGADMVSKAAGQYKDYKDFQEEERKKKEAEQKRKDLEAMLLKGKTDKSELDELLRMKEELSAELVDAERQDYLTTEANKAEPMAGDAVPSSVALTKLPNLEGFSPNVTEPQETVTPINTSGFNFGFTPRTLPQLRGF